MRFPPPSAFGLCFMLALACVAPASAETPAEGESPGYDIAQGTLDDALRTLANRANLQLLYSPALVRGKRSAGLQGRFAPAAALARLLTGQGLTAVAVNPNTWLLQSTRNRPERAQRSAPASTTRRADASARTETELPPVNVVGTRIPRTSYELSMPVTVINAEEIARSGYGTLYELLREQPGMFGHHPVAVSMEGGQSFHPVATSAATSLYSLGPRGTLFLVDGRRVANAGVVSAELGGLFDLNGIPLDFIERIEILRGGASAVYGADAMAGTVNIVLKQQDRGGELTARYGGSERGDAWIGRVFASIGTQTRGGGDLFVSAGAISREALEGDQRPWHTSDLRKFGLGDQRAPIGYWRYDAGFPIANDKFLPLAGCVAAGSDPDSPLCRHDSVRYRTLQPEVRMGAAYAHWRQPLGSAVLLRASLRQARVEQRLQSPPMAAYLPLPEDHPDRRDVPAGYNSTLYYAFSDTGPIRNRTVSDTSDIAFGLDGSMRDWNWALDLSRSAARTRSTIDNVLLLSQLDLHLNEYRLGMPNDERVLDLLRTTIRPEGRYSLDGVEASIEGASFALPAGPARVVAGLSLRREHWRSTPDPLQVSGDLSLGAGDIVPQHVQGRSAAAFLELGLPLQRTLHAELAARLEHHDGFGQALSPRMGLTWTPSEHLLLRASLGKGYRVPALQDRRNPIDPRSGLPSVGVRIEPGMLPCVGMETGRCTLEHGSGENPALRPESSRSVTTGLVWAPTTAFNLSLDHYRIRRRDEFGISDMIRHPSLFPEGFVRDANNVLYRVNEHLANIGRSDAAGWEFDANYLLRHDAFGEVDIRFAAHYLQRHATTTILATEVVEHAGHDIPKLTALGNLRWRRGDWTTTLGMRHAGPTFAFHAGEPCPQPNLRAGRCRNPSTTLFDIDLGYAGLERWTLSLHVGNLFDRQPVNYAIGLGGYRLATDDPYGRYYMLSVAHRF